MYSELFWDHARNPRNRQALPGSTTGESRFQRCGDRLTLYLQIKEDVIHKAAFEARACAAVIAVASIMTSKMVGLTLDQVNSISILSIDQELGGLPASKRHAYLMVLECLDDAIQSSKEEY